MDEKARMRFALKWRLWLEGPMYNGTHCWVWTAGKYSFGYGAFSVNGHNNAAHIATYRFVYGEIPIGLELDHMCHNPPCVNPEHLQAVTHKQNLAYKRTRDGTEYQSNRTHCPRNHLYEGDNLFLTRDGRRQCRACTRDRGKRRYHKNLDKERESRRISNAKWRAANVEKVREKARISVAKWRAANPEKAREAVNRSAAKRRAREKAARENRET